MLVMLFLAFCLALTPLTCCCCCLIAPCCCCISNGVVFSSLGTRFHDACTWRAGRWVVCVCACCLAESRHISVAIVRLERWCVHVCTSVHVCEKTSCVHDHLVTLSTTPAQVSLQPAWAYHAGLIFRTCPPVYGPFAEQASSWRPACLPCPCQACCRWLPRMWGGQRRGRGQERRRPCQPWQRRESPP